MFAALTRRCWGHGHLLPCSWRPLLPEAVMDHPLLRLPERLPVTLVQTQGQLQEAAEHLAAAAVAGVDVEWASDSTEEPSASIVQLAVRGADEAQGQVFILDILQLPDQQDVYAVIQSLLRSKTTLKVGFGLKGDLWAVAQALPDGNNCIAVVNAALEVRQLHAHLQRHGLAAQTQGGGLAAVVDAELGVQLDKTLQCSAWGKRPLSEAQVQYAALDAYCLLQLLDEWAAAVPPAQLPMHEQPASSSPLHEQPGSPAESAEAEQQAAKQPEETLLSADNCQGVAELSIQLAVLSAEATADASEPASAEQPHPMGERSSEGTSVPADATAGPSVPAQELSSWPLSPLQLADEAPVQAWPQQAALHWGCRLEMLNRRRPVRRKKGNARQRKAPSRSHAVATERGFPQHLPWEAAGTPPRFVADVMVEGLARQLRMVGVDVLCAVPPPKHNRHHVHRWLITTAIEQERVILTQDRFFITAQVSQQAYFVKQGTKYTQLPEVLTAFGLNPGQRDLLSRCVKCNGNFKPTPVLPQHLPPEHRPPDAVCDEHRLQGFWVCAVCGQAYWQGTQFDRARRALSERLQL